MKSPKLNVNWTLLAKEITRLEKSGNQDKLYKIGLKLKELGELSY